MLLPWTRESFDLRRPAPFFSHALNNGSAGASSPIKTEAGARRLEPG